MDRTIRRFTLGLLGAHFGEGDQAGSGGRPGKGGADLSAGAGPAGMSLWAHQEEGLVRVRRILDRRGGAILADSVGLGKTHIALAVVREELEAGGQVVVVVPASLRPFWRRLLRAHAGASRVRLRLVSHTQLGRGSTVATARRRLVVVDEAHRFRNPRTLRHAALSRLVTPGTRVLLLTATPVNNRIEDLLHLLRLFCPDDGFRDLGIASVVGAFENAAGAEGSGSVDPDVGRNDGLSRLIRAVVVRRTRAMVRERFGEPTGFPRRAEPIVMPYDDPATADRVAGVAALECPLYEPGTAALVRLGLLKRLDSSRAAFRQSVGRLQAQHATALEAVRAGRLPVLSAGPRPGTAGRDPLQLVLVELVTRPAPPGTDLVGLARSLDSERRRLEDLLVAGPAADPAPGVGEADPKLVALIRLLERARGERTLVFTEYRATAGAVWQGLVDRFPTGRIDGGGAWLGRRPAGRRAVVERFAPLANGRAAPPRRERVEVLVATDVLSEGLNLQDAGNVVSYDLPWNPVRLLQRVGRIDRAGSPHDEVVPFLFVPARGLDRQLGLTRRLRAKLGSIEASVGVEHGEALLVELGHVAGSAPATGTASHRLGQALDSVEPENRDPVERLRTLWVRHRDATLGTRRDPPCRWASITVPARSPAARLAWVVAVRVHAVAEPDDPCRPGQLPPVRLLEVDRDGLVSDLSEPGLEVFRAALEPAVAGRSTSRLDLPVDLPVDAVREFLRREKAVATAPARLPPRSPAARWAMRLRRALAGAGAGLDPDLLAEADKLLPRLRGIAALRGPADAGGHPPVDDPAELMRALRVALGRSVGAGPAGGGSAGDPGSPGDDSSAMAARAGPWRFEVMGGFQVVVARATDCG